MLASPDDGLVYVEGWIWLATANNYTAIPHAWIVRDDQVVEPTPLKHAKDVIAYEPAKVFTREEVEKLVGDGGENRPLHFDHPYQGIRSIKKKC